MEGYFQPAAKRRLERQTKLDKKVALGWSGFFLKSSEVTLDLDRSSGSGPDPAQAKLNMSGKARTTAQAQTAYTMR